MIVYKMKIGDVAMTGTLPELAMASGYPIKVLEEHLEGKEIGGGITIRSLSSDHITKEYWDSWIEVTSFIRKRVKWVKRGGRKLVLPRR